MKYNKEDVKNAGKLLESDYGLVEKIKQYASILDLNNPLGKTERFHEQMKDVPASIGSLLIAAAQAEHLNFGHAHLCLKTELIYSGQGNPLSEDDAVEHAYQILDSHGAITIARLEQLERETRDFRDKLRAVDQACKEGTQNLQKKGKITSFKDSCAKLSRKKNK